MKFEKLFKIITEDVDTHQNIQDHSMDIIPVYSPIDVKLVGKAFQLLKNDQVFSGQLRNIMDGFKKNRQQITPFQKDTIKTSPNIISNLEKRINNILKIVNDPKKRNAKDHGKFIQELNSVKSQRDNQSSLLKNSEQEIEQIIHKNEEMNSEYIDQMILAIRHTAKRLKDILERDGLGVNSSSEQLVDDRLKDIDSQMGMLSRLQSDGDDNPIIQFLDSQEAEYQKAKTLFMDVRKGDNYVKSVEQLYMNLPLAFFINEFKKIIASSPKIKLSTSFKIDKEEEEESKETPMEQKLRNIKSESEFESIKPSIKKYIKKSKLSKDEKDSIMKIVNGPFIQRVGGKTSAERIIPILGTTVSESFDNMFSRVIERTSYNDDDFKIDTIEILEMIQKSKNP